MNFYDQLLNRLLENIPSKLDKEAAQRFNWPLRPEDNPDISKGSRRLRVRDRKKQRLGSILSGGGLQRLRRKAKSPIYSPQEAEAVEWQVKQKLRQGLERHEKKRGAKMGEEDSRKKKDS